MLVGTTPYGIDYKIDYEWEKGENPSLTSPGAAEGIYAWPVHFSYDELALADAWVSGEVFTFEELEQDAKMIEDETERLAWADIEQEKAIAAEYRAESKEFYKENY